MNEAIQELIDFIKTASPVIWETLIRQVYVEVAGKILWVVGLLVLCFFLFRFGKKFYEKYQEDSYSMFDLAYYTCLFFSGASGVMAFSLIVSAIMWAINPQFYAIRYILQSLTP